MFELAPQLMIALGLAALLLLIALTRRCDPFGRDATRVVMFDGFCRDRRLAVIVAALLCGAAIALATISKHPAALIVQTAFGIYCLVGALPLIPTAIRTPSASRNCDPCLMMLVLALGWPLRWLRSETYRSN